MTTASTTELHRWRAFAVLAVSYFMTIVDLTIVNVALPTIGRKLHFTESNLQWVVTAYGLTFGGFLLLGGRAADLLGRRRIMMIGLGLFTTASLGAGLATSAGFLIAMRALQGLGAAVVLPAALSIVTNMFSEGAERNKALGAWGAIGGTAATIGLISGGLLTRYVGWQYIFGVLEETRAPAALNVDETGWYLSGEPRTLWGAVSKRTAVLRIAPDCGKQHLHGLIGDGFASIVGSDRFSAYNSLEPERRQVCWSHLRRDFTFHADLGLGSQETFGLDGLEVTWNVFQAWKPFQQDGDRDALQQHVAVIKTQMRPLLEWGSTGKRQRHVRALAKNLLKLWPALWTFADVPDVEPTNNAAERGLRAAVIYRKLSLGSRSQGGERTIERLLSVDQTCRLQRRSLYAYLSEVLAAKARGDPLPALV